MTASLARLFTRLPGACTVARSIEDSRIGAGRFDGEAALAAQSEGARGQPSGMFCTPLTRGSSELGTRRRPALIRRGRRIQ